MIENLSKENHIERSLFIRKLIQTPNPDNYDSPRSRKKIPMTIVQFWDNLDSLPEDVQHCIDSWKVAEEQGIERVLFDTNKAKSFIIRNLGLRYLAAFELCYHPAMQSDYFRLCYIFIMGGCYIDADDVYSGSPLQHLFADGNLKIQPLCYDKATSMMVPPEIFTDSKSNKETWIFYFNNNPLIACGKHPVIEYALNQATMNLEQNMDDTLPEIQSTTGPGNLSKTIFDIISRNTEMEHEIKILNDWEAIAKSKWELNYRNDSRNWRLSNSLKYKE